MRHHLLCGWLALVSFSFVTSFAFGFGAVAPPASAPSMERAEAVKLASAFVGTDKTSEQRKIAAKLAGYKGSIESVLARLGAQKFEAVKPGYRPEEHFSSAELLKKHPDDLLYFMVPESYRADRPTGLIVFMHGGGATSSRRAPRMFMNFPPKGEEADSNELGDIFNASGMIAVGPSAPWDESTSRRWCVAQADEYLADVIAECKERFNIDADRVFLIGHSMGGFGSYQEIQRQPDRFAGVIVSSGSWSRAYLPMWRGTPLAIMAGIHDARPGVRWHYTDVAYARWTDELLKAQQLDHVYYEHDGKHAVAGNKRFIAEYLKSAEHLRRDPYYPHVVLASPVGSTMGCSFPVAHNRWLTLNESREGDLEYDELVTNGASDFDRWQLKHRTVKRPGAAIDATNRGDNRIEVTTTNVAKFTVWLHPKMVDVNKPVAVVVNGKNVFNGRVAPSLATALESYERRGDWGLIYPMKIEVATVSR